MTILYEALLPKDLKELSEHQKIEFISELITFGKIEFFNKFKDIMDTNIFEFISPTEMLKILPMTIDPELLVLILDYYDFKQGQHFFYNYAIFNKNKKIKILVYEYFVENYSDVLIDNMKKYETMLEN